MWDRVKGRERGGGERQKQEREREENEICINDLGQFNPFAFFIFLCFASHLLVRNASRMREDHEHKGSRIILILFPIFFHIFIILFFWVLKQNVNAFSCELSNCQLQVLFLLLLLLLQLLSASSATSSSAGHTIYWKSVCRRPEDDYVKS